MAAALSSSFFFCLWHLKLLTFLLGKFSSLGFGPAMCFRLSCSLSDHAFPVPCFYYLSPAPLEYLDVLGSGPQFSSLHSVSLYKHMKSTCPLLMPPGLPVLTTHVKSETLCSICSLPSPPVGFIQVPFQRF